MMRRRIVIFSAVVAAAMLLLLISFLVLLLTSPRFDILFPGWSGQSVQISVDKEQTFTFKSKFAATYSVALYVEGEINGSAQLIVDQVQTLDLPADMNKTIVSDFYVNQMEVRYVPGPNVSGSATFQCEFYGFESVPENLDAVLQKH